MAALILRSYKTALLDHRGKVLAHQVSHATLLAELATLKTRVDGSTDKLDRLKVCEFT